MCHNNDSRKRGVLCLQSLSSESNFHILSDRNQFRTKYDGFQIPLKLVSLTPSKLANVCFDSSSTIRILLLYLEDQASSVGGLGDISSGQS